MGTVIRASMLSNDVLRKANAPIILCSFSGRLARLLEEVKYVPLNMNIKLAELLLKYPADQRPCRANDEVMSIISQCSRPTILEDYNILFDPRYNIDAIKVFTEMARRQKVIVKWLGRLNGNILEYATPDDKDYNAFRIQDYNITCVMY